MNGITTIALVMGIVATGAVLADEKTGERPYEMVWANRTQDTHPPLVDFENVDGWKVETEDAVATLTRSREQQLWGSYVGKLVYRGTSRNAKVTVRPPQPMPIPSPFDCVNFWVYGNNIFGRDRSTPPVGIHVLLLLPDGKEFRLTLGSIGWKEWWVMHRKLQADQLEALKGGARFAGIQFTNGSNKDDRVLYFDNLAFYQEELKPLTFDPRPKRGIDMFPGQTCGTNTGPGRLPFPNRDETILPDNLTKNYATSLRQDGKAFVFRYKGDDGELEYRYDPRTATLGDITVTWGGWPFGKKLQPAADGGVRFSVDDKSVPPERSELLECRREGNTVAATWRLSLREQTMDVTYTFRLWQKSLVVDVKCLGGQTKEFVIGRAVGAENPRLVTLPYLVGEAARPAVLVTGKPDRPLFATAFMDYYRSNASKLVFVNDVRPEGVTYNGGSLYTPKTDGKRNDCFERLFFTVSPRFEEVLPNIPNPKSPWMHVAGERLWRAHGAGNREKDYATWEEIARYGMTKVVITDHESGWRDSEESFTFRTKTAPKRGGDESQKEYARKLHALGFRYGIYNNYTDYAPVNEFWNEDMVGRNPDGNWHGAWYRCYGPKPLRAVEFEARLAPIIQQKFQLSTAYCDVHTCVTPWGRVDYDARVPGAGTFLAQFYPYGEIMLHQKATWNGPVYSEGNNHYYYCGLTDGNYGQDSAYRPQTEPWLVDFDLRKMHPLCCNFGMGSETMFYGRDEGLGSTPPEREARLDRFLAATAAFGHTGFLIRTGGMRNTVRSYYMLQQLHTNYAQETATQIQYADEKGRLLDTSAAVATGAFRRSQIVTTYSNGLRVWVNGHTQDTWKTPEAELPPNGYFAKSADRKLLVSSELRDGRRVDYVDSPGYVYCDGRGVFTRFHKAACDEALIALTRDDGTVELIPVDSSKCFAIACGGRNATAVALDKERKDLGPAETRLSRGLVHVIPKEGAFSYLLTPTDPPALSLACERDRVVPGETVAVCGTESHQCQVPLDAQPGKHLWQQFEGKWIDFSILPPVHSQLVLDGNLRLTLRSNLPTAAQATVRLLDQEQQVELRRGQDARLEFALTPRAKSEVTPATLYVAVGGARHEQTWWLKSEPMMQTLAAIPEKFDTGQCLRGGQETAILPVTRAGVYKRGDMVCGEETKPGIFMHPPYQQGLGYAFALYAPVALPSAPPAVFRCSVGKANGSDPGDGILFQVAVLDESGRRTVIASKQWIQHAWTVLEADLSPWAGRQVRIQLVSDVGPADNSSGDWACWADMRIETRRPVLVTTLHDQPVRLRHEPGPYPVPGLRVDDLRKAKRGWFHYEGIGIGASAPYISAAQINAAPIGNLPGSPGCKEAENVWSQTVSMELTPAAIQSLSERNKLRIMNPGGDCFKIRHFWIELELADGHKCSSRKETTIYSQPPTWAYAEGVGVPQGDTIQSEIVFDVQE